ncbi:MAG: phosphoribosylformylglycinamidine synthase subunit PurQ [Candidatus Zixiibacteriota bacterium]|nr:MAG: phosphoribosylformylglycinamidine synthase subunit PurQ [candidate division Zixibacteria bacterium]
MKFGVITFPGSNCDYDAYRAVKEVLGEGVEYLWHQDRDLREFDVVILPGGFSYGDYLRTGAIARFSAIMGAVKRFAQSGGLVLGICNGFQILLEAGLLPGAMLRNRSLRFVCKYVYLRVENNSTPFTNAYKIGQVVKIPIAHSDGNYFGDAKTVEKLEESNRVVFRYCNPEGELDDHYNPNGSLNFIAGIMNSRGNVIGMMPHPERATSRLLGSPDGRLVFESMYSYLSRKERRKVS